MALPGRPPGTGHSGSSRLAADAAAARAVRQALRHAGIGEAPLSIRIQREPFDKHGERAEAFAHPPRFPAAVLRHVELRFATPRYGPLVLGNGRWLGLGLFAPVAEDFRVLAFDVLDGLADRAEAAPELAYALRRAVMARVRDYTGSGTLHAFFTGHRPDGAPLRDGRHRHLAFACDAARRRLLVIAPHALEGRAPTRDEEDNLATLFAALADLSELRAGHAGLLRLRPGELSPDEDPLLVRAQCWRSVTPYVPTRHAKALSPAEAIAEDVRRECQRRGWPLPVCEALEIREGPRGGLSANLRIRFAVARPGPILLGRTAHGGGGLFEAVRD